MKTRDNVSVLALTAIAVCQGMFAQTTPQPTTPAAPTTERKAPGTPIAEDSEEIVIELSPFVVSAEKDEGYHSTETLAGTRIRTDLRDVGSAISVYNKTFLEDIGAVDNTTLLQYTVNAEVGGTRSTYAGTGTGQSVTENLSNPSANTRVRGLSAADNTRDFFISDIPWDGFDVDRIDIQRGPNSILFGLGKPAGIVNASLKNAEFRNSTQIQNRFGSYGSVRTSVDFNRQLIPKTLAIRLSGLWDHEDYRQKPAFKDDERFYGALRFDPKLFKNTTAKTSLRVKFENGRVDSNTPRTVTPNDNLSHWFRPTGSTADNPWGGLNKALYDPYYVVDTTNTAGDNRGQLTSSDPEYNPWIGANASFQQQQPIFMFDGGSGQLYQAYAGYLPFAMRTSTGAINTGSLPPGIPANSSTFLYLNNPQDVARIYQLPNYSAGLYRQWGLRDSSVFDFYNMLIDGPNKWELKKWDAINIDLSQTFLKDRLGFNLTYDRQDYRRSQEALFGGTPTLNVDINAKFQDLTVNPNAGRAFVSGSGSGSWYETKREVARASVFAELRATDLMQKGFWTKLLGRHRLNGVYSSEEFYNETRSYDLSAAAQSWYDYSRPTGASTVNFYDRAPTSIIYIGPSMIDRNSPSGLQLPGIRVPIVRNDAPVNNYYTVWNAPVSVAFNAPWNRAADPVWSQYPKTGTFTQADNPANYVGWNQNHTLDMVRVQDGEIDYLSRSGSKQLREVESLSGTLQSFLWNEALVGTIGWRYDTVESKSATATTVPNSGHGHLWLSPENPPAGSPATVRAYRLPDRSDIVKGHTFSWGAVLHLNRILEKDILPINVSVAYNTSSNFEVVARRVDVYGDFLPNPSGKTQDWSIRLSTKDNKYSFRATQYKASVKDNTSSDFDTNSLGSVISSGLTWRNVYKYDLSAYTWDTRNNPGSRNTFGTFPGETTASAAAREAAAIAAWDDLQAKLDPRFYTTWSINPNNGAATPEEQAKVQNLTFSRPPNFAITEDVTAKGNEFEFTANPTKNWRISASASKSESFQNNIGGKSVRDYIDLITYYMNQTDAGELRQFSGAAATAGMKVNWNTQLYARWTLKKLQEGTAVPEIRKWRYSTTSSYKFSRGWLKNVGAGGSYRWEDKSAIGYPIQVNGNIFTYDLNQPYYGPSEDAIDLWLSYERKIGKKLNWKIQLNVRNAFAKEGLIPVTIQPDGQTWAQVRTKPNQEWFVTNTFSF